jgi:hypothetical protein
MRALDGGAAGAAAGANQETKVGPFGLGCFVLRALSRECRNADDRSVCGGPRRRRVRIAESA